METVTEAVASILRKALTDDEMLEVARTLLTEMGELDLLTPADLQAKEKQAHDTMLARAYEAGEVVWSQDMLVETKAETFWVPIPQVGARVTIDVHLSNGTHTIVGELVAADKQAVIIRDEKTGARHYLPSLQAQHLRVI